MPYATFFTLDHNRYTAYMLNTGNKGKSFGFPRCFANEGQWASVVVVSYTSENNRVWKMMNLRKNLCRLARWFANITVFIITTLFHTNK